MTYMFRVDGNPHGKDRPRYTVISGHPSAYTTAATRDYEAKVKAACRKVATSPINSDTPVSVTVEAVFAIPKSYGKRKSQALYGSPYAHKPDADNCIKSVLDGANGVAYEDDAQVTTIKAYKRYILSNEQPHVDVFISPIT